MKEYKSMKELLKDVNISSSIVIPGMRDVDFAIRVSGNGMYPKYSNGDILICREIEDPKFIQWGKVYTVLTKSSGMLVRRLIPSDKDDYIKAETFSENYPPFDIKREEIIGYSIVVAAVKFE